MTYAENLQQEEWKIKRIWIIKRDNYKCTRCGKDGVEKSYKFNKEFDGNDLQELERVFEFISENDINLNVHHLCYRDGHKPWEYGDDELITLCPECHKKIHEESKVPIYDNEGQLESFAERCDKCGGSGYIPKYKHVENGVCFKCHGEGVLLYDL